MRLELEILDGPSRGKRLTLKNGMVLGNERADLPIYDDQIAHSHAIISLDQKNSWNISCLDQNKIRVGLREVERAKLMVGLVFNLGQTGFKVVERASRPKGHWKDELKTWLEENPAEKTDSDIFFFLRPIRLSFTQGPQYEVVYTLSYGPRELGFNSLDLNIKDPATPQKVARFFQISDQAYIENLCGDVATINNQPFFQHPIAQGDLLRVASSTIELSIINDD